jgi:hypothetical protein
MTAPCRPLDLVCAFGESPCRPGLLDVVFMRCKNRTGQNRTEQHNQHNQQKISPPLGTFSRKTRRSPHACTRTCEQRGANERWEGICLVLGSSCAPHPLTQHSHGTKRAALARPYANRKQVLQSLSVKRVRMRDVCAGPRLARPRGIGQHLRALSHACTLASFETRPQIVLTRGRVRTACS